MAQKPFPIITLLLGFVGCANFLFGVACLIAAALAETAAATGAFAWSGWLLINLGAAAWGLGHLCSVAGGKT